MKNSIVVTIPFSFKGEELAPSSVIDLDQFCEQGHPLTILHQHVATENKIGKYSYEYEVIESSSLIFSDATGLAIEFCKGGQFDLEAYKKYIEEIQIMSSLQSIALEVMGINNLEQHADLKEALLRAYRKGKPIEKQEPDVGALTLF